MVMICWLRCMYHEFGYIQKVSNYDRSTFSLNFWIVNGEYLLKQTNTFFDVTVKCLKLDYLNGYLSFVQSTNCMSKEHACDEGIVKYLVILNEEQQNMINTFRIPRLSRFCK